MNKLFAHMADIHLDSPFDYLNDDVKQNLRKVEQREVFKNAILDASNKGVSFVLISGDLFDGESCDITTLKYIDDVCGKYPFMPIIIIAGNHDVYKNNNIIYQYPFTSENIIVLSSFRPVYTKENVRIYGYIEDANELSLDNSLFNILMWHGNVENSGAENPLPVSLKNKGFDYIAMGHIHQFEDHSTSSTAIYYPGCLIARGFDENGQKGYLLVEVNKEKPSISQQIMNQRLYENIIIDVSKMDYESIISISDEIRKHIDNPSNSYRVVLKGYRTTSTLLNKTQLLNELASSAFYIKVKDSTTLLTSKEKSPIEQIYAAKMDALILNSKDEVEKNKYIQAKEIGLKALRNEVIYNEDM